MGAHQRRPHRPRRCGYLGTTLDYYVALQRVNLQTLFGALTGDDYRTPALYIAVQPFLRLFGPTADGAQV